MQHSSLPRRAAVRNTFLAGKSLIQRLETQARGQRDSFSWLTVFTWTAHGSVICLGNRLVQSLLHVGRELATGRTEFQGLTPFQLGTVSSKQESCWGLPCTHMWEATVRPPSPPTRPAPVPWGPPHHHLLAPPSPNTPAQPCCPNHSRPRPPSVSLSWPREPHDFSVFLKTNSWLSSVSWWKNVKAMDQTEAELIAR